MRAIARERELADVEPRRAEAELGLEPTRRHATGADPDRLDPPRPGANEADLPAREAELPRDTILVEHDRPPDVMRGGTVVGVVDRPQVWHGGHSRPDVVHVCSAPAGRREEVRRRNVTVPGQHLPGRPLDGEVRSRCLIGDAAVDLTARIGVEIEVPGRLERREGVRARRDCLGLERRHAPAVRHLAADDAAQVLLERQRVHDR